MHIHTLQDHLVSYLNSFYFPLTIAILAYLTWVVVSPWSWIFVVLYLILLFLPLFSQDGRGYLPLVFYPLIIVHSNIHFLGGIPATLIVSLIVLMVSGILYLIIHKPTMVVGKLFWSFLALFSVFFLSFLFYSVTKGMSGRVGVLYLLGFFAILAGYLLMNSVLGKEETLPYFAMCMAILGTTCSLEVVSQMIINGSIGFASSGFSLGWSYTRETVSTIMMLSLPFFSILISRKETRWIFPEIFVIINLILLSTDSGLLSIMLFLIPLVVLTLKDYGKLFPYYTLAVLLVLGVTIGILMGVNTDFNRRIVAALTRMNFSSEASIELYSPSVKAFVENPYLGISIASCINDDGTLSLCYDTVLSTMKMGGSFALAVYVLCEVFIYITLLKKQGSEKWLMLIFFLILDFIGLIDNTIYNLAILLIMLMALSVYQQSNKPEEVIVHEDYYLHDDGEWRTLRNRRII